MIGIIAAREWRALFVSPLAWGMLAVAQGGLAWIFVTLVADFQALQGRLAGLDSAPGVTDLVVAPLFQAAAWVLLLLTPLLTMRLFSEERRAHTFELLLSAPVSASAIVLGKYLGVLAFLLLAIALVAVMPLTLALGTTLDQGKLLAGLLGLGLLIAASAAAGLYLSLLTTQPALAAVATFGLLLMLWLADIAGARADLAGRLLGYLAPLRHYEALLRGLFDSADVAYYLLFITLFLGLAVRRLDDLRLRD